VYIGPTLIVKYLHAVRILIDLVTGLTQGTYNNEAELNMTRTEKPTTITVFWQILKFRIDT